MIYLSIVSSIVSGIVRFILGIVISTFTFGIISEPLLPYWVTKIINIDKMSKAYYSLIYMHHLYNNPIFVTASSLMIQCKEK